MISRQDKQSNFNTSLVQPETTLEVCGRNNENYRKNKHMNRKKKRRILCVQLLTCAKITIFSQLFLDLLYNGVRKQRSLPVYLANFKLFGFCQSCQ